jgi:pyocin large subunit-like protein
VNSDLDAIATSVIKRDKALQKIKNEKDPNSSKVERAKKDIVKYTEMQIKHATRFERSYKKHRSGLSKQLTAAEVKQVDQFIAMGKKGKLTSISQLAVRKI